ncbi:MAG: hypothetical protein QHH14_14765 [Clostridiales bacterium]|jgi:hypothetical protein|nr:hypothetical protein [Clostridiales bacterium]
MVVGSNPTGPILLAGFLFPQNRSKIRALKESYRIWATEQARLSELRRSGKLVIIHDERELSLEVRPVSNGLAWHPKNIIFSFLEKHPNATPHQIIGYMIEMGYRTWVPTLGQAAWCIRMYRANRANGNDGQKEVRLEVQE